MYNGLNSKGCYEMEIIFIRHGKAEKRHRDLIDLERHLTDKGKKKFQKLMPSFKKKLKSNENHKMLLWSSPANRALETAKIVANAFHIEIDRVYDFIYGGNFEELQVALEEIPNQTTLIIVGHEPILSEWVERITGEQLQLKKGEIINIQKTNQSPLEGNMEWSIKP